MLPPLYAILTPSKHEHPLKFFQSLLDVGVSLIQVRDKEMSDRSLLKICKELVELANAYSSRTIQVIINDRIDLVALSGAAGVHLGQDDIHPLEARKILGPEKLIGLSTHTLDQLESAPVNELDYLAFGPVFKSKTKSGHAEICGLEKLREVARSAPLPLVAIGGITAQNAAAVFEAGASSCAVIRELEETNELEKTVQQFEHAAK